MSRTRIARALNRAVLASLAAPLVLASGAAATGCSGAITTSGGAGDPDGGGSGGASGSSGSGSGNGGGASGSSGSSGGGSGSSSNGGGSDSGADRDGSGGDSCPVTTYVPVYGGTGSGQCLLAPYACGTPLPQNVCIGTYDLAQPSSYCSPQDGGALLADLCVQLCPDWYGGARFCNVFDDTAGGHVTCNYGPCATGRRPEGLQCHAPTAEPDAVAAYLAQMAHLEAASVVAFDRLTRELEAYAAPERLRAASRDAARDEKRHARTTRRLAERLGGRVPRVRVEPRGVRPLLDVAVENAVEGCVRETFGAAVAMIQARRVADARLRRAMKGIARDEVRHAELSWAVARWIDRQLDAGGRRRVQEARTQAVEVLAREVAQEPDATLTVRLGIPSASQARAVLGELQASLWSTEEAA